jgi:TATA-binding protein-associated factor
MQAMDRAHRIGQRQVVHVHRLVCRDTLEERIMGLQQFKLHVAGAVVNAENASMATMQVRRDRDLLMISARFTYDGGRFFCRRRSC